MKTFRFIAILAGIVLLELFLCVKLALVPVNLAKEPYRRQERAAALFAYGREKSLENERLYREETRLVSRHVLQRQLAATGVLFAILLVIDGIVIMRWRHHERREATA